MADYSSTNGWAPLITMVAGQVDTVTFPEGLNRLEVIKTGDADLWWTCDGSTPGVNVGYFVPAGSLVDVRDPKGLANVVKLFSTGTPKVRVQTAD